MAVLGSDDAFFAAWRQRRDLSPQVADGLIVVLFDTFAALVMLFPLSYFVRGCFLCTFRQGVLVVSRLLFKSFLLGILPAEFVSLIDF